MRKKTKLEKLEKLGFTKYEIQCILDSLKKEVKK